MALTPNSVRFDKKCGQSGIPENKVCRVKGASAPIKTTAQPQTSSIQLGNVLAGTGAALSSAYLAYNIFNTVKGFGDAAVRNNRTKMQIALSNKRIGRELFQRGLSRASLTPAKARGAAIAEAEQTQRSWRERARAGLTQLAQSVPESSVRRRRRERTSNAQVRLNEAESDTRADKKCGKSGIADNKKCTKQTSSASESNKTEGVDPRLLLTGAGVLAVGSILGVVANDIYSSGVPKDKVPPKVAPSGLYDTFKPGDLVYQTAEFAGANRAHYAVYVGKRNGKHMVFDTSATTVKGKQASQMQLRDIETATGNGTSFARATRVANDRKRPTAAQLEKIIQRLQGKTFDWTGFETNCETLARTIVNDLPVSTQSSNISGMTQFMTTRLISAMAPEGYRRRAVKQTNIQRLVTRTIGTNNLPARIRKASITRTSVIKPPKRKDPTLEELARLSPSELRTWVASGSRRDAALRRDKKCGASGIPENAKCHKGGSWPQAAALGAALAAGGIAAFAFSQGGGSGTKASAAKSGPPQLPGLTPRGLLPPAPARKSKTQRMRENTATAVRQAEGAVGRAAQAEITRAGAVANAMAATGEATGMAAKTTLRELRLRAEAARRRYEPGYRRPDRPRTKAPAQLPEGGGLPVSRVRAPSNSPISVEALGELARNKEAFYAEVSSWKSQPSRNPATGQPRRSRARGFGRTDGPSTEYYRTHPEAAAKKVRTQAKINRRPEERERRAELNRERRKRGIDGQGGPDMSHTTSGRMVAEAPSTNRARNGHGGQPRLRKDSGVVFVTPRLVDPGRQDVCWAGYVQAGMKRKGKKEVPNCVLASSGLKKPRAQRDAEGDGKKYTKVVTNPETGRKKRVRYGAKGYRIAPGTDKGDRYCARSFGDMKSHGKDCSGADRNTPLCLSRAKWKCSGESSRRGDALTPGKS